MLLHLTTIYSSIWAIFNLSHGPREHLQRPCINAMFRSAAAAYGERVAGVLLTGLLDDGAAGLWAIQQQNGATRNPWRQPSVPCRTAPSVMIEQKANTIERALEMALAQSEEPS